MKPVARDTLSETELRALDEARSVSGHAYAPYSGFRVGAALVVGSNEAAVVFAGCNIENASYGLTICAERSAAAAAVSSGRKDLELLAIYTPTSEPTSPCGACRQFLNELAPLLRVLVECESGVYETSLPELLPHAFGPPERS